MGWSSSHPIFGHSITPFSTKESAWECSRIEEIEEFSGRIKATSGSPETQPHFFRRTDFRLFTGKAPFTALF